MNIRYMCAAAALALGLGSGVAAQQAAVGGQPVPTGDDKEVTLTGCVVKGDGGYVLSTVGEGVTVQSSRTTVGTSGATTTTTTTTTTPATPVIPAPEQRFLYWLDDGDELEKHAGHRVEVTGEIEGEIERGEIEVERENNMIELEIKAKGEKITVKLPDTPAANNAAVGTSGIVTDEPKDIPFKVRKFDVKSVKVVAGACQ
ncbi:MAG TPA: hypothetical protein VJ813_06665 [Vicinamibacterales bacterium]|nr:hypothetical protein [Vicinamibacterales bacterium]